MSLATSARRRRRGGHGARGPWGTGAWLEEGWPCSGGQQDLPAPGKGSMAGGTLSRSMQIACKRLIKDQRAFNQPLRPNCFIVLGCTRPLPSCRGASAVQRWALLIPAGPTRGVTGHLTSLGRRRGQISAGQWGQRKAAWAAWSRPCARSRAVGNSPLMKAPDDLWSTPVATCQGAGGAVAQPG